MHYLKSYLEFMKTHKNELKNIKLIMLLIVNAWLMLIFWKILLLNDVNLINNNHLLVKASNLIQPVLNLLGLDVLTPNMLKMCVITSIIMVSNLAVLYLSQMMALLILGITARYSFKAYNNYINKDTLNYYGFEKVQETLTFTEKSTILDEFIKENAIKDPSIIGFLQNKINNVTCLNKNELLLNINNCWLDYKQQLLSKLVLNQKVQMDQIETINKKGSSWSFDSIDYWTLLKIGGGIIIVAVVIFGGYSYFNNNAIKTAGEIGKKAGEEAMEGTRDVSKVVLEHSNKTAEELLSSYTSLAEGLQKEVLKTRHDITNLTQQVQDTTLILQENQIKIKDFIVDVTIKNDDFIKSSLNIQNDIVKKSQDTILENINNIEPIKNLNKLTQSITLELKATNENITQIQNSQEKIINITNLITKESEDPSILSILKDFRVDLNICLSTGTAILAFLGASVALDEASIEMVEKIRELTGRENVYQRVLDRVDLNDIEPVDVDEVNNEDQETDDDNIEDQNEDEGLR